MDLMKATLKELQEAKKEAEAELGFSIPDVLAEEILEICKRKLECSGKREDYLPVLFRYELPMKLQGDLLNVFSLTKNEMEVDIYVFSVFT